MVFLWFSYGHYQRVLRTRRWVAGFPVPKAATRLGSSPTPRAPNSPGRCVAGARSPATPGCWKWSLSHEPHFPRIFIYIYMIYTAVLIYCWYIDTNTAACMVKSMVKSCRSKASGNTTWLDTKILGMYQLCFLKKRRWPSRSWLRSSVLLDPHGSPTLLFGGKKNMLLLLSSPHVCCFNNGQS